MSEPLVWSIFACRNVFLHILPQGTRVTHGCGKLDGARNRHKKLGDQVTNFVEGKLHWRSDCNSLNHAVHCHRLCRRHRHSTLRTPARAPPESGSFRSPSRASPQQAKDGLSASIHETLGPSSTTLGQAETCGGKVALKAQIGELLLGKRDLLWMWGIRAQQQRVLGH